MASSSSLIRSIPVPPLACGCAESLSSKQAPSQLGQSGRAVDVRGFRHDRRVIRVRHLAAQPHTDAPSRGRLRRLAITAAGPMLIVAAVLVVLHGFAFGGRLTLQHVHVLSQWLPTY